MNSNKEYKLTIDLNVLDHLGINLYSNIAAVVTEAVANAWDADATEVHIDIDNGSKVIEIKDNGIGMSFDDINDKYLTVGYRRRENEERVTELFDRPVMGRKGLGKLSLFSIANVIEVHSKKKGEEGNGLLIDVNEIRKSFEKNKEDKQNQYTPKRLENCQIQGKGTSIILRKIKRERFREIEKSLRRRLGRRFSIIGPEYNFQVFINGSPLTIEDRLELKNLQFLWHFGEHAPDFCSKINFQEVSELPDRDENWDPEMRVTGWIGTSKKPQELKEHENLNSIVLLSRGRIFQENILEDLSSAKFFTKYITGQIEIDFLDDDEQDDIATSDRQRIIENDKRYIRLKEFLKVQLATIDQDWSNWRSEKEIKEITHDIPVLETWINSLQGDMKEDAKQLISNISRLNMQDIGYKRELYKHGILAFERLQIQKRTRELPSCIHDSAKLLALLADRDSLEGSLYRNIIRSRLDVVKEFQGLVNEKQKEKILQEHLFNHLWLLEPSWDWRSGSQQKETRFKNSDVFGLTKEEKASRVDIAYMTVAGKHVIVELKRPGRKVKLTDLYEQGKKYVDKVKKILTSGSEPVPIIEVIFVISEELDEDPLQIQKTMDAVSVNGGGRIIYYDELIDTALQSYKEFLDKTQEFDKVERIVNSF